MPTLSAASYMGMMAATLTSIIESVGDYYACARISGESPPPAHAVNRGIAIEGFGSLISGAVGSGGATTSYSQNVGAIGFTKVRIFNLYHSLTWFALEIAQLNKMNKFSDRLQVGELSKQRELYSFYVEFLESLGRY